ncbi:MAG: acriflavin resistance protein [uncultured bacterium (gcode 4)]|uniref:Acriflavin resistance protein n=1 Tax=uncultured bacterium (gcode 4) TaxID=1234023 RepID=K2GTL9_9BACT|nr:MAG: acriflavin resistance protein [uncultured bacterium (gcode 4)]
MKKKIIAVLLVSSLLLVSCWGNEQVQKTEEPPKYVTIDTVKKDFFAEQIKLVGKVSPIMETPISPLASGVIKDVLAEVWQKVKAWQVLAKIDLGSSAYGTAYNNANTAYNNSLNAFSFTEQSIEKDLESAKIQLDNARAAKDNAYITTEKQLELAQTQLDNIKKTLQNSVTTTSETLKNANLLVENAKTNINNFNITSGQNLSGIYENLKVTINWTLVTIDSSITQADTLLWITDKNKNLNDSYETYLWAKNSSSKTKAELAFHDVLKWYTDLQNTSYSSLDKKANDILDLLSKDVILYENITNVLNNTISSVNFPQTQLDGTILNISKTQGAVIQAQSQITTIINTLNSTKTSIEANSISLGNALNIALSQLESIKAWNNSQLDSISWNENLTKAQLENTVASVKQARDNVDNALKMAQASFDSINAKLNAQRIQAKSAIDSAKWWKDLAWISLDNTSIIAPYDGIITARNIEIWSSVGPWMAAFMIWDNDSIKIKMDINSENVTNLNIWQVVEVTKQENTYTWIVSLVSPSSDPNTKMFKSEISFSLKPENLNLWDFVDVYISKNKSKEKSILVPYSSLISLWQWEYNVFVVWSWSQVFSKSVKIWSQNSKQVQVISGLSEWEQIVVNWALNLQDGDKVEENNNLK